ncbi:hypothetical protein B4U80_12999 [Leptotrombidium deliense]|uniref:F-box domain-containing protein n=1 Tax=Leptotrombidium deliense TaxID=299467 RepID=A0A443SFB1_9ACAR|nr:hypothetical protein B4U80_12999 [Leptotrombidium deliense]
MLTDLPEEVISNIFSFLNVNQLLPLRLVSHRTKEYVDFAQGSKKSVFKVTKKDRLLSRLQWRVSIFKRTKQLILEKPAIRADILRLIFMNKFKELSDVKLCGSKSKENDANDKLWPSKLHIIGECFPNITRINFHFVTVDDDSLTKLFSLCQKISTIDFLHCDGSKGKFLSSIPNEVRFFSWSGKPWNPDEQQISNMRGIGRIIHYFVYDCMLEDDFGVQHLVANELKDLQQLSLSVKDLRMFSQFSLCELKSIMLYVDTLSGSLKLREPCLEVKTVIMDVQSFRGGNLAEFISNFPNVRKLKIWLTKGNNIAFDETLMNQITCLKSLRFFQFADDESGTRIGRKFLKHFANSVKHLSWKGQILWSDFPPYMRDSDITGFGRNFESLTYDCFGEEDGKISSLIANEMKNLKYLYLSIRDLYSFSNFSLPHLVTLNLSIRSFIGTTKLQQPCMLAKTVDVEFKSCGETDLADFISNFPNVENLRIILLSGNQIVFDAKLMKQICSLRSLRFFEFRDDKIGTNKYLTLDGGVKNAFVETIRSLHWVEKIKLRVSLSTFLMNELRQIAEQRPNQFTSEINIGSYDLNDEDFDDDDTVSEFSD